MPGLGLGAPLATAGQRALLHGQALAAADGGLSALPGHLGTCRVSSSFSEAWFEGKPKVDVVFFFSGGLV